MVASDRPASEIAMERGIKRNQLYKWKEQMAKKGAVERVKEKRVADSQVEVGQVMQPEDTNPAGNVHGGTIMKMVDNAAAVVASRHCRRNVVTASVDRMNFHNPVYLGDLVFLKASLNWVGRTSMVIGVRVEAEELTTGKRTHTASAYLTFVALDEKGKPYPVPQLALESPEEEKRFQNTISRSACIRQIE